MKPTVTEADHQFCWSHLRRDIQAMLATLDTRIVGEKSLQEVRDISSPISSRWRAVTLIQPGDFIEALRSSLGSSATPPCRRRSP